MFGWVLSNFMSQVIIRFWWVKKVSKRNLFHYFFSMYIVCKMTLIKSRILLNEQNWSNLNRGKKLKMQYHARLKKFFFSLFKIVLYRQILIILMGQNYLNITIRKWNKWYERKWQCRGERRSWVRFLTSNSRDDWHRNRYRLR